MKKTRGTDAVRLGAPLVSLVRHTRQKRLKLQRAFHCAFKVYSDARVRIVLRFGADPVSSALCQGIPIGPPTLRFISDASVEIILMPRIHPEWKQALRQSII